MKYKALQLLLTVSILAMSMATLFTACPEPEAKPEPTKSGGGGGNPEVDKSATAPGQAGILSADDSKQEEITFKATAPIDKGTNKGGAAVEATKLKYWLYYAKVGITSNSVTVSGDTTAADVIKAVGSATGTDDKAKGRIEASAANLATGFKLSSLTAETKYRYTVVVIHPDGTTNSDPAPAATSGAVRAKPSQATETGVPILNAPNPKTSTGFTVTWNDADLTDTLKDDGEPLQAGDVEYKLYYTSATTEPADKEAVKSAGSEDTPTSGNVPVAKGVTKTATASGKAFVHTVYMVLEAINTTDTSKTKLSEITKYAVTGAATSPTVPTVNVTPGEAQLTVQVTALSTGFGTTDNGTPLDTDTVTYIFYYAKKGEDIDVDDTSTNVENAGVTSDHMYDALKALTTNTAAKGKVELTPTAGIGTPKVVPGLSPATDYHYTVRVQEKDTPTNGANTPKAKATTPTPPKPKFWHVSTIATGFNTPYGIAATADGNTLYVADSGNHLIKKLTIDEDGKVTVDIIAGDGTRAYTDAEASKDAQFERPYKIAAVTDALYITEYERHRIRRISLNPPHAVSTIAGGTTAGKADSETGTAAQFNSLYGIALDQKGSTLYVADTGNHLIRKITLTSPYAVETIAGSTIGYVDHATGTSAKLAFPQAIVLASDALYAISGPSGNIRKIALTSPHAVSGGRKAIVGVNINAIALAPNGTLYALDAVKHIVMKITLNADGSLRSTDTIAGGTKGTDNGIGDKAQFNGPYEIVAVSDTLFYVADILNNSIRKLEYKE